MAEAFPYTDGAAVWAAARDRARVTARGSSANVGELLRQFVYTRFLARVFDPSSAEQWVLKGGTAILARVRDARHTADVDLLTQADSLERALEDLRAACAVDVGDHFRFEPTSWRPATGAGTQPDVGGIVVTIDAYCGVRKVETITVDLVSGSLMWTATVISDGGALLG